MTYFKDGKALVDLAIREVSGVFEPAMKDRDGRTVLGFSVIKSADGMDYSDPLQALVDCLNSLLSPEYLGSEPPAKVKQAAQMVVDYIRSAQEAAIAAAHKDDIVKNDEPEPSDDYSLEKDLEGLSSEDRDQILQGLAKLAGLTKVAKAAPTVGDALMRQAGRHYGR